MAEVKLDIGGRAYIVTCQDGEEDHLKKLGTMVNEKVANAHHIASGLTENRQLLFAALLLADELHDVRGKLDNGEAAVPEKVSPSVVSILDNLADRIETLASSLEKADRVS